MKTYGLIGHPLSHSLSKDFFDHKFEQENLSDCEYLLMDLNNIKDVIALKNNPQLFGFNVTIPYKQSILPYLDSMSEEALKIGAVNTVKVSNGKWTGYNTDVVGFEKSLIPLLSPNIKKALVLGSGGAYLAVKYVLDKLNISCSMVSRQSHQALYRYENIGKSVLNDHQIIINTTPIGMFPNENDVPNIPFHLLTPNHIVYDLIYNPEITLLLRNASLNGCYTKNGLEMLKIQAQESWKIWNNAN
jgi:shikimate dehydrogenase